MHLNNRHSYANIHRLLHLFTFKWQWWVLKFPPGAFLLLGPNHLSVLSGIYIKSINCRFGQLLFFWIFWWCQCPSHWPSLKPLKLHTSALNSLSKYYHLPQVIQMVYHFSCCGVQDLASRWLEQSLYHLFGGGKHSCLLIYKSSWQMLQTLWSFLNFWHFQPSRCFAQIHSPCSERWLETWFINPCWSKSTHGWIAKLIKWQKEDRKALRLHKPFWSKLHCVQRRNAGSQQRNWTLFPMTPRSFSQSAGI